MSFITPAPKNKIEEGHIWRDWFDRLFQYLGKGYTAIPISVGAPTFTPITLDDTVPMVFDTTNSKIWVYTGGVWKGVVVT
jgi:hypothetical protein